MNFKKASPIIICGMHGGGTSYATKLLRFCGLFVGFDAGNRDDRKWHESKAMKDINIGIQKAMWGTELTHRNMARLADKYVSIMKSSGGDLGRFSNAAEMRAAAACTFSAREAIGGQWGWKDPRNGITLGEWLKIFPNARVLSIHRKWSKGASWSTSSGRLFAMSSPRVRYIHEYPMALELSRKYKDVGVFRAKFERMISDPLYFNTVLEYVGIDPLNTKEFDDLLKKTKCEV